MDAQNVDVEQYRAMVAQEAWFVWKKLPPYAKAWIGVEDLIEDGMCCAAMYVLPRWKPDAGANFGTFLHNHLYHFFDNKYLTPQYRHKRLLRYQGGYGQMISLDGMLAEREESGQGQDIEMQMGLVVYDEDVVLACHIVHTLPLIHQQASPELQAQMAKWFLSLQQACRHRRQGRWFRLMTTEFQQLARQHRVTIQDCRHLLKSPTCLDAVSRKILAKPYNLNDPTPGLRGTR